MHSHKPPLTGDGLFHVLLNFVYDRQFNNLFFYFVEIIKDYLPYEPKCLELFARYLLPGWKSYGDQVITFQNTSLFEVLSDQEG